MMGCAVQKILGRLRESSDFLAKKKQLFFNEYLWPITASFILKRASNAGTPLLTRFANNTVF